MDRLAQRLLESEWDSAPIQPVHLSDITLSPYGVELTQRDLKADRLSRTSGPVLIWWDRAAGEFYVEDGMHRVVAALDRGDPTILARVRELHGYRDDARETIVFTGG